MKRSIARWLSGLFMLLLMLGAVPGTNLKASAATTVINISVGQSREILLGATILTGKLTSGTWSSSNPSVARITSQSPSVCNVEGVSTGKATISCKYKYYIAGTYVTSYWSCSVEVTSAGGSGGSSSSGPMRLLCEPTSLTWDLAKSNKKQKLSFEPSKSSTLRLYASMDVRNGEPQFVSYSASDYSANGSPVFWNMQCTLWPEAIGSETITFQLVHRKDVNGYTKYYNTTYGTVDVDIVVMCSHIFDQEEIIQEGSEFQSTIKEYTCSICNEVKTEEVLPVFGNKGAALPKELKTIEDNAFEGVAISSLFVHDNCTTIGAYAFKDCKNLKKIRLPKNCSIHPQAFAGCERVYVFAPEGGTTMEYCESHDICVFMPEVSERGI